MLLIKRLLVISLLAFIPSLAMADDKADHLLSVHILNQQTGKPAEGVNVRFDKRENGTWKQVSETKTDKEGRANALYLAKIDSRTLPGEYRVIFETQKYFSAQSKDSFFPEIPVVIHITSAKEHYHVPLLLSQHGYSTYRGH
ncbi:MAG: 5-hydroxyisourate hydrolase [Candidatus Tokpelaia hoelldobleri]|uniref:5-hydroxyisourate hydrolase n=1 Tax=Candidatus Tokpelaia hoelldobleri TaxID=1902579 RepID=A0A1U9JW05_9HYPH|nr:MAG: 5-hydroxyisourate hydrolase [Candidatus Tokpelaia hoelldoblerii]